MLIDFNYLQISVEVCCSSSHDYNTSFSLIFIATRGTAFTFTFGLIYRCQYCLCTYTSPAPSTHQCDLEGLRKFPETYYACMKEKAYKEGTSLLALSSEIARWTLQLPLNSPPSYVVGLSLSRPTVRLHTALCLYVSVSIHIIASFCLIKYVASGHRLPEL